MLTGAIPRVLEPLDPARVAAVRTAVTHDLFAVNEHVQSLAHNAALRHDGTFDERAYGYLPDLIRGKVENLDRTLGVPGVQSFGPDVATPEARRALGTARELLRGAAAILGEAPSTSGAIAKHDAARAATLTTAAWDVLGREHARLRSVDNGIAAIVGDADELLAVPSTVHEVAGKLAKLADRAEGLAQDMANPKFGERLDDLEVGVRAIDGHLQGSSEFVDPLDVDLGFIRNYVGFATDADRSDARVGLRLFAGTAKQWSDDLRVAAHALVDDA